MTLHNFAILTFFTSILLADDLFALPTSPFEADELETVVRVMIPEADAACGSVDDYHGMKILVETRDTATKHFLWAATLAFTGKGSSGIGCQSIGSKIRMEYAAIDDYTSAGGRYSTAVFYDYTY